MNNHNHQSLPENSERFRDNTEKQIAMRGVSTIPAKALCWECGVSRTYKTGSIRKGRFICHSCGRS